MNLIYKYVVVLMVSFFISTPSFSGTACKSKGTDQWFGNGISDLPVGDACWGKSSQYKMTLYEFRMCKSFPTEPTTSATFDLSNCELLLSSNSGEELDVKLGEVTGNFSIHTPPTGQYTHAYARISNIIKIKGSVDFGISSNLSNNANRYCVSTAGAQDTNNRLSGNCSSSDNVDPQETLTEKIKFGNQELTVTGTRGKAFLLDSNQYLSSEVSTTESEYMVQVKELINPVIIDNNTKYITLKSSVTKGLTVKLKDANTVHFDIGPFDIDVEVE